MKNLSILLGITFLVLTLASCKTITPQDLRAGKANSKKFPALDSQIDIKSLEDAYSLGSNFSNYSSKTEPNIAVNLFGGTNIVTNGVQTMKSDKRIADAKIILEREIRDNISDENIIPNKKGIAKVKITTGQTQVRGYGFLLLSIVTLCVPNLFGMPFHTYRTDLELEMEIRDCNNNALCKYTGIGSHTTPVAFWHGYDSGFFEGKNNNNGSVTGVEGGARKSNIEALKMAMNEIKQKVEANFERTDKGLEISCK